MDKVSLYLFITIFYSTTLISETPFILVPGAGANGDELRIGRFNSGNYFGGIIPYLKKRGFNEVYISKERHNGNGSILERALDLTSDIEFVSKNNENAKVHIIAHSMGGLVARQAAYIQGASKRIQSITTISTPHFGTPIASFLLDHDEHNPVIRRLARIIGYKIDKKRYLPEVTLDSMEKFNQNYPNKMGIDYYSYITSKTCLGMLTFAFFLQEPCLIIKHLLKKRGFKNLNNDGIIPEMSQAWGTVLGKIDIDHAGIIDKNLDVFNIEFDSKKIFYEHMRWLRGKYLND